MTTGIGIVGCGNISSIYLKNLQSYGQTDVVAVADQIEERARAKANEFGVAKSCTVTELLEDPDVDIVLNLTVPKSHSEIARLAVEAGKHVYNEKPLTVGWEEGQSLIQLAKENGVMVGCAPDTVLGAGLQTCREVLDSGVIGTPVAAQAFMMCPGHESWHPDPAFYYEKGGGPLFDMGPYYLSALIMLLGSASRVTGSARASFPMRTITSEPKRGQKVPVETPTHLSTVVDFANSAVVQLTTSFDVIAHSLPCLEVYGSEGSMRVPDPNGFGGPVEVWRRGDSDWSSVEVTRPYAENSRGLGVLDMALAQREGRPHRANGDVALHALEIMHSAHWASDEGRQIELSTAVVRPEPMPRVPF